VSNLLQLRKVLKSKDSRVLFIISEADLNTFHNGYVSADKIDQIYSLVRERGLFPLLALHPFKPRKFLLKTSYNLVVTENFIGAILLFLANSNLRKKVRLGCQQYKCGGSIASRLIFISMFTFVWKVKPKVVVTIGASPNLALVCEILGVKLIEIMHGAFSKSVLPTYWIKSNNNQYEKEPKPSLFFSWDSEYDSYIEAAGVRSVAIGYPVPVRILQEDLSNLKREIVLVSLTWGLADSQDPFGVLAPELWKIITKIHLDGQLIRFRLHPVSCLDDERKRRIVNWLAENFQNVETHDPRKFTLHQSLEGTRLQITDASSTFFEAALMGIPTVMTSGVNSPIIPKEMLESGLVVKVEPGEEFLEIDFKLVQSLKRDYTLNKTKIMAEIAF
jgi:hypothetical protein